MSSVCEPVRPLLLGTRRAVVDGHPICAACGTAAVPVGPDRWRHREPNEPYPYDSPWLAPVTWAGLRDLTGFADFTARYPDVARGVSEEDWREGRRRWAAYQEQLDRPGENPLLRLVTILAGGRVTPGFLPVPEPLARVLDLDGRRRELAARFSWAIPTEAALGLAGDHGPLLEVGAGTGYWAALLRARGVDVRPTDAEPAGDTYHRGGRVWTEVTRAVAVDAVNAWPDRTLLVCWPPPDDDAAGYAAVRAYAGDTVLYIGGGADGPTGTARLHRELDLNWTVTDELALPSWPGIPDRLTVWRRSPVRRPLRIRDRCPQCTRFVPTGWTGRCDRCVHARPAALALRSGAHRIEYTREMLVRMPAALRAALERSTARCGPPPED
ncbi:hypothetical protein [Actinophytocola sp.]|uniref:hypothetical protein n=1 Tax=Actinophytocola sp. TaxID=1872138 RepID=UPI002D4E7566|nr:hypothetical protein [Actinophytocola sp.]HYQ67567.1 hypothetical protein [Actinophytocola sp.]